MYRVIVVDDEPILVRGLSRTLALNDEFDLDVYSAYSADEAIVLMEKTPADILITDIQMPVMSGIELSGRVKEYWPECKIIFLTAHDQFDYVYHAIQQKDSQYVLKMEVDEKLNSAIRTSIEKIVLERQKVAVGYNRDKADDLSDNRDYVASELLRKVILSDQSLLSLQAESMAYELFDVELDRYFQMMVGKIAHFDTLLSDKRKELITNGIVNLVKETLDDDYLIDVVVIVDRLIVALIQPKDNTAVCRHLIRGFEEIQNRVDVAYGIGLSITYSDEAINGGMLSETYDKLKNMLFTLGVNDAPLLISSRMTKPTGSFDVKKYHHLRTIVKRSDQLFVNHDSVGIESLGVDIADAFLNGMISFNQMLELFGLLQVSLLHYLNMNYKDESDDLIGMTLDFGSRIDVFELMTRLKDQWNSTNANSTEYETTEKSHMTHRIRKFVEEHISEDLSLNILADLVHYNPSYLSRAFKDYTGITLSKYILNMRIEKSKELLLTSQMNIGDIANEVGIESASYFSSLFKKFEGITPNQYRIEH